MDNNKQNKLTINTENKSLKLDILSSTLDRNFSSLEFGQESKNIYGYNLTIDTDNLRKETLRDLEEIANSVDKMFMVKIFLDGQELQGSAKIAENMGLTGISLSLELHN